MNEALKYLAVFLTGSLGTAGAILLLIYFTPAKAEKWFSIFLKGLMALGIGARALHKRYVLHDIQGRVNNFLRTECRELPGLASQRVDLQYVDGAVTKQAIITDNKVLVRIRRDDPQEKSFVHAICLFVSKSLLFKAKRYIGKPQGEATDLLVSMKLLQQEKPAVVGHFLEEYLHPAIDNKQSKTAEVFDDLPLCQYE